MLGRISPWPVVKNGQNGHSHTNAAALAACARHDVAADGIFGPGTEAAVRAFQAKPRVREAIAKNGGRACRRQSGRVRHFSWRPARPLEQSGQGCRNQNARMTSSNDFRVTLLGTESHPASGREVATIETATRCRTVTICGMRVCRVRSVEEARHRRVPALQGPDGRRGVDCPCPRRQDGHSYAISPGSLRHERPYTPRGETGSR
jgi:hypothetical protein